MTCSDLPRIDRETTCSCDLQLLHSMSTIPIPTRYVYPKFRNPRGQIRLLTVSQNRDPDAVVEAKLSIHNIPSNNVSRRAQIRQCLQLPFYLAVSYVWGTGAALQDTKNIMLDGFPFPVTAHVYEGMREARIQASGWAPILWFDAICIDQKNKEEKAAQIPLMREIYRLAAMTCIYIPGDSEDMKLMRFISQLTILPWKIKVADWFVSSYTIAPGQRESIYACLRGLIVGKFSELFLTAAFEFFVKPLLILVKVFLLKCEDSHDHEEKPIASRLESDRRTIQRLETWEPSEACLQAIQSADLAGMAQRLQSAFGAQTQYFNRIWTFQEVVASPGVWIHCGNYDASLEPFLRAVYYLHRRQGLEQSFVDAMTTLWNVKENWNKGVRLSLRELLFHCRHRECLDPKDKVFALLGLIHNRNDPRLLPNNKLSVAQVYANATKYIASSERSLDVICVRGKRERPEGLPSWAPNFQHFGVEDGKTMLLDASGQKTIFQASLGEAYVDHRRPDQQIEELDTRGLCLGAIQDISPQLGTNMEPILTWINTRDRDSRPEGQKRAYKTIRDFCASYLYSMHQISNPTEKSESWTGIEKDAEQLSQALRGRRLALLDGEIIAAVPDEAKLGDKVCVLISCSIPVCLREGTSSGAWTLVGECYVHGYMHGEAIRERDSGKLTETSYLLV
jgi:hypothetical protein